VIIHYPSLKEFLDRGGIIAWGIVPTYTELLEQETIDSLIERLESFWEGLSQKGVDRERLLRQSLLAPGTCNLINPDKEKTVEKAFDMEAIEEFGLEPTDRCFQGGSYLRGDGSALDCRI